MYKYIILLVFILLLSCQNDISKTNRQLIIGEWTLNHATRNNKVSKTLENTLYKFDKDQTLTSNLFLNEILKYEIKGETIIQSGQTPLEYNILMLKQDSMTLETNIGKHHYVLSMIKKDTIKK